MTKTAEVAIVGGGASGMMAAITAAQTLEKQKQSGHVVLLEKENRIGKKLLATGNGRCNLSNLEITPEHYHMAPEWAAPLLSAYPAKTVMQRFEKLGLLCRSDSAGRVYPYNLQSAAVLEILRLQLQKWGVEVRCDWAVTSIEKKGALFSLRSSTGDLLQANRVILSSGGKAAPKLGADGSGAKLAKGLGHTIVEEVPSLVPVKTDPHRVKALKGMRSLATVTLLEDGSPVHREEGEVQFTDYGLSGICIFQISGRVSSILAKGHRAEVSLDLMADWKENRLTKLIGGQSKRFPDLKAEDLLCGFLNQKVGQSVIRLALGQDAAKPAGECTFAEYERISAAVKDFRFPITGTMGWDNAQVTSGGVDCKEVDPLTMASKKCSGLYLTGELLALYGDCGGYNLHWAWCSGMAAGEHCAMTWEEKR